MASKNKYIVFAVIGIAAASGAAWWLQKPAQSVRSDADDSENDVFVLGRHGSMNR